MNRIIECPTLEYDIEMRGGLMFHIPKLKQKEKRDLKYEEQSTSAFMTGACPLEPEILKPLEFLNSEADVPTDSESDGNSPTVIEELIKHPDLSKIIRNKLLKHLETLEMDEEEMEKYIYVLVRSLLEKKSMPKSILIAEHSLML
tara:strand:- start:3228 stop:3662 length:435 start_codon:yes stop_codon:yes gene_type:complete